MTINRVVTSTLSLLAATALIVSGCGTDGSEGDNVQDSAQVVPGLNEMLPQKVRDSGVLTVATDPQSPPCDFTNESGEIDGFNHDILMAMAPRLGVEIRQTGIAFDGLLPG